MRVQRQREMLGVGKWRPFGPGTMFLSCSTVFVFLEESSLNLSVLDIYRNNSCHRVQQYEITVTSGLS